MIARLLLILLSIPVLLLGLTTTRAYAQKHFYKSDSTFNFKAQRPARVDKVFKVSGGNYIVAGEFDYGQKNYNPTSMLRLDSRGNVDRSFNSNIHYGSFVSKVVEQPDKKLLVLRSIFSNGVGYELNRLNADGSHDASFSSLPIKGSIHTITLQQDGKILAGGDFSVFNNTDYKNLVRLNADGTLDKSFTTGTGPDGEVLQILLMGSEILVSGSFSSFNGFPQSNYMVALAQNGEVLRSYFPDGFIGPSCSVSSVAADEENNIYFYASAASSNRENYFNGLGKIKADGSIDRDFNNPYTFQPNSRYLHSGTLSKIILANGYVYLAGSHGYITYGDVYDSWAIVRLLADGRIDDSFQQVYGQANDAIFTDGNILLAGQMGINYLKRDYNMLLVDLNGIHIPDFKTDLRSETFISTAVLQSDTSVFVAGRHSYLGNVASSYVTKLSLTGKIDASFDTQLGPHFNGRIVSAADGFYVGESSKIKKMTLSGDFDPSFTPIDLHVPFTPLPQLGSFGVTDQNKLIVSYTQHNVNHIVKYNADGTPDAGFIKGAFGESGLAFAVAVQPDGKILVAGRPSVYNSKPVKALFRLNQDGSIDDSFDIGSGISTALPGGDAYISVVEIEPSGDILISGSFETFGGAPSESKIIKLKPDGSFKAFVIPQDISITNISSLRYVPADSSIIVTGNIHQFNGFIQVAKLNPYTPPTRLPFDGEEDEQVFSMFPNPATDYLNVQLNGPAGSQTTIRILSSYGHVLQEQRLEAQKEGQIVEIPLNALPPGIYLIDVTTNSIRSVKRIVKL